MALTATADARVVADVSATLALRRDAFSWTASFNRPRLRYEVRPKTSKPKAIEQIAAHVRAHADESGLVYCLSRRDCEVVCEALGKQLGARARVAYYHAELDADESGALSKQELRPLIAGIGAEMGVPPEQPESAALFEAIFETADFDMSKQIEVSEFKELMRSILQTMAENLRDAPVTVTSSSTAELDIFDGQALRALLDDTDRSGALKAAVEEQFKALDINEDGRLSLEELRSAINAMTASEDDVLPLPLTGEGGNEKAARALTNSVTKSSKRLIPTTAEMSTLRSSPRTRARCWARWPVCWKRRPS